MVFPAWTGAVQKGAIWRWVAGKLASVVRLQWHTALCGSISKQPQSNNDGHGGGGMARLAQSAERKALNLVVVGSSPTVGVFGEVQVCGTDAIIRPADSRTSCTAHYLIFYP